MSQEAFALTNAILNATSGVCIVTAYFFIKREKNIKAHRALMCTAVTLSATFLVLYVTAYFLHGERSSGLTPSILRTIYYLLLLSHVILAVSVLPMIAVTITRAAKNQIEKHRKIAPYTFWVWLYVSVTGVIVYIMLYHVFPGMKATA